MKSIAPLSTAPSAYAVVGRYAIFDEIAAGGMATVHLGKMVGAGGFSRVVAIKRLHPQFSKDEEFSSMFMDEARLAARIHHPNVVQTLDVVTVGAELLLVMEYVHGVSFASLLHSARKARQRVDPRIVAAVVVGALEGLHAAHEAKSEVGVPLGVVHRDVSPQNVLVGIEGVARLLDFGVAKAAGKMHATREGQLKGKLAYMSPEQVRSKDVTRQSDVFSTAVVLWEALMGERLFDGNNPAELIMQVISEPIASPRTRFPDLPPALDAVVMRGLAREASARYATARDMAVELEDAVGVAPAREVARWVEAMSGDTLRARTQLLEQIERAAAATAEEPPSGPVHPLAATFDLGKGDGGLAAQSGTRSRSTPATPPVDPGGNERSRPLTFREQTPHTPSSPPFVPLMQPLSMNPRAEAPSGYPDRVSERPRAFSEPPPSGPVRVVTGDPPHLTMEPRPISDGFGGVRRPSADPPARPHFSPEPRPVSDGLDGSRPSSPSAPSRSLGGADPRAMADGLGEARPSSNPLSAPVVARGRRVPIPIPVAEEAHISLRERLETPFKIVAVGVVLSLIDAAARPYLESFPVRPLWVAEVLVVVGVIWALARLVLPLRPSRD